uniref:Bacteriophage T7 tail fibre protein-like N-terminal domain-containing protein n=1 Tax=uncultured marine microorganism HF4000_48F7 TaxID=455500 RepID=B3SZU7_9ZZZZ|nr:hypothetical protein ALOHA_HF400048F7ctg1g22 [uncultured marine microorganism HF4000_48F7]
MTVSVKRNQVQFGGDGSTTAFTVNFPYTELTQVKVFLDSTEQTRTTHFTLTDPGATGTVTFGTAPAAGKLVTIKRETDYLQAIDYVNNDALDAETLEKAFDKLTMMCQQLDVKIEKSIGFEETVSEVDTTSLKLAAGTSDLAGKLLAFDSTGAFVTTQEIGTFKGSDGTTTTAAYVVRDLIRDNSNDNVYFTKVNAAAGSSLTDTNKFELLVDVATVRTLKTQAETAKTASETAQAASEAALASFQGQFKTGATNPYTGTPDNGDLWYDTANNILKYYVTGTGFEPVTTSLATVSNNYLSISNQVITAGTVPISLGGTGGTSASEARTLLGVTLGSDVQAYDAGLQSISGLTTAANKMIYTTGSDTYAVTDLTAFARTILDDSDAATVRTTLGLDSAATTPSSDYATAAQGSKADSATQPGDAATTLNVSATDKLLGRSTAGAGSVEEITLTSAGRALLDDADAAAQRTTLGLGTAATSASGDFETAGSVSTHAALTSSVHGISSFGATLVDDANASTARTTLGLGTISTQASDSVSITGGSVTGITDLAIADGGTGASSVSVARSNLLPNYSGNGSKVLALNSGGTDVEWVTQSEVFTAGVANAFEHPNSVTDSFTVSSSDHRFYVGPISFTNTVTLQGKMLVFDGLYTTTAAINITGTLHVRG